MNKVRLPGKRKTNKNESNEDQGLNLAHASKNRKSQSRNSMLSNIARGKKQGKREDASKSGNEDKAKQYVQWKGIRGR